MGLAENGGGYRVAPSLIVGTEQSVGKRSAFLTTCDELLKYRRTHSTKLGQACKKNANYLLTRLFSRIRSNNSLYKPVKSEIGTVVNISIEWAPTGTVATECRQCGKWEELLPLMSK
jgi:hypothetical protein